MIQPVSDPGSFRDPGGRVFHVADRVYRAVYPPAVADFEYVESSGLLSSLVDKGWVIGSTMVEPAVLGDAAVGSRYVVEHPRIPFVSYPYEWPFAAMQAAALLHLDVHLDALEHGVSLSDGSAFNIQFIGSDPVFIDRLSFIRYVEGSIWAGYRQFCEQFLNPLLLGALLGVSYHAWYRGAQEGISAHDLRRLLPRFKKLSWNVLTNVVLQSRLQRMKLPGRESEGGHALANATLPAAALKRMLRRLRAWIERLEPVGVTDTVWADYTDSRSYAAAENEEKRNFVTTFVQRLRPRVVWDLGCNTGEYSQVMLDAGAGYVVGFDSDHGALHAAFERSRANALRFLPLYMDARNPPPSQGWAQGERHGLTERASAQAVVALALVHHLVIGGNVPLPSVVDWLVALAPAGVIEFVPKSDPMVQVLLSRRPDIFPDYQESAFLELLARRCKVVSTQVVSKSGRRMVWFERH